MSFRKGLSDSSNIVNRLGYFLTKSKNLSTVTVGIFFRQHILITASPLLDHSYLPNSTNFSSINKETNSKQKR